MTQLQSLHTLQLRETQERDQALGALRNAERLAQRAGEQAQQLLDYRAEYEARWKAQFHRSGTMEIMACYRSFMQRLDQAVTQQARQVELAQQHAEQCRAELLERERKLASVRKLLDKRVAEGRHSTQRREQKHNDDLAQRMHAHAATRGSLY